MFIVYIYHVIIYHLALLCFVQISGVAILQAPWLVWVDVFIYLWIISIQISIYEYILIYTILMYMYIYNSYVYVYQG